MLDVTSLTVRAGAFLLHDLTINVKVASCHVVLGATGSGKTVFLESLIGLRRPVRGIIRVNGVDVTHAPVERRGFGYVPQDLALFPHMTVRENILYAKRVGRFVSHEGNLYESLVDCLGIHHILDRGVSHLSGGERQRVALARAIFSGSRVLILDEPLSSLHEGLRRELWFVLKDIARTYQLAILLVTHDLDEACFLGDSITILLNGRVRQQGSRNDVLERPRTSDVALFLGIRNLFSLAGVKMQDGVIEGYCLDLQKTLRVRHPKYLYCYNTNPSTGDGSIMAGIRSEDVTVLRGPASDISFNTFDATVEGIYESGHTVSLLMQPKSSTKRVECSMPIDEFQRLKFVPGEKVHCRLAEDKLFVCEDT